MCKISTTKKVIETFSLLVGNQLSDKIRSPENCLTDVKLPIIINVKNKKWNIKDK